MIFTVKFLRIAFGGGTV